MRELFEHLEELHAQHAHEQIVQEISQLGPEGNNPIIVGIYARALNNLERYEQALTALESVRTQAEHDALWHYRSGYALLGLGRAQEAVAALAQAAVLDPADEEIGALLAKARGGNVLSPDDPQYLLVRLQEALGGSVKSEIRENQLWIPGWRVTIRTGTGESSEQMAVLYFWISSPDWDRTFFECSAALGQDKQQAVGMALGSFVFGLLGVVGKQALGKPSEQITHTFAGKEQRWKVYQSNLIGMGETPAEKDFYSFWKLLHKGITDRLGNQQAVYVKVYAARNGEEVTGECRVNDEVSAELSALVGDYARGWQTKQFGSQKQFFILRQEEGTAPYTEARITEAVHQAVALFGKCQTNEQYGRYLDDLIELLGDRPLAEELDAFLPEFCAESAFRNILYPETIRLRWGDREETLYKSQLASYDLARRALYNEMAESYFDDDLFGRFVSVSSIYSVIQNAKEQGANLEEEGGSISLCCSFSEQYQLR